LMREDQLTVVFVAGTAAPQRSRAHHWGAWHVHAGVEFAFL
jgi:hypothetical protein